MVMDEKEKFSPLDPSLNHLPGSLRHIYFMGICGTGMASLAGMLKTQGLEVTGSDQNMYPPMSNFLQSLSIPVFQGYRADNLIPRPDLVIVGNVIRPTNPEVEALARADIPYLSFPQAVAQFALQNKEVIVVAGTHGKTTTTSAIAWLLEQADLKPGFLIGGIPLNFQRGFHVGKGRYFVIEGDEYDSAFFDKGPKFLHYKPSHLILTNIEFDHADIYRDIHHLLNSFKALFPLVPPSGYLVANMDEPRVRELSKMRNGKTLGYGFSPESEICIKDYTISRLGSSLTLRTRDDTISLDTLLYGRHNLSNITGAVALALGIGIPTHVIKKAVKGFRGVKRRQEVLGEVSNILVIDDFAHHPTEVSETLAAVKERFPLRRLIAVFEPRSNSSRRNVFQTAYAEAFDHADLVMVPEPSMVESIPPLERFSSKVLTADLTKKGIEAYWSPSAQDLLMMLLNKAEGGDVILFMSNGGFQDLPRRFLRSLEKDYG